MKTFEQWWIKNYKYCVIAGVVFVAIKVAQQGLDVFDVKSAIYFIAIITSPIGALIGQVLVWIFKLIKLLGEIYLEYRKLHKEKHR